MVAHILPLLVVSAGIGVSARALPVAQGVTDAIAPSAAIPPSCSLSAPNTYGLSISPASGATPLRKRQAVSQIPDGQLQATANVANVIEPQTPQQFEPGCGYVTQIIDGQIQVLGGCPPTVQTFPKYPTPNIPAPKVPTPHIPVPKVPTPMVPSSVIKIEGGQIQVPQVSVAAAAASVPQSVGTANYAPSSVTQIGDGQIQAPQALAAVNAASIPQPVVGQMANYAPSGVTQLAEGQIQVPQAPAAVAPASSVTQIEDGQIQAPQAPAAVNAASIPQPVVGQMANYAPSGVTQLAEGQIQVPQVPQVSAAAEAASVPQSIAVQEATSSEVPQPPAPSSTPIEPASGVAPSAPVAQIAGGKIQARQNGDLLGVTLNNGVLTDRLGRTGYIASNRQLQFDAPAQAGAIYTAGFSACDDGTLGLGASNVFYACGSSDFNNIYDQSIYPDNCNPVHLRLRE